MNDSEFEKLNNSKLEKEKREPKITTKLIAQIGVMVAILIVGAQIAIPLPWSPVPLTMQTLIVMLVGIVFKPLTALSTVGIYILMGLIGIPVFAGFNNFTAFAGPTGGFIISFLAASFVFSLFSGIIQRRFIKEKDKYGTLDINYKRNLKIARFYKYSFLILLTMLFTAIVYTFGTAWFMIFIRNFAANPRPILLSEALLLVALPFLPGDIIKAAIAIAVFSQVVKLRK